MTNDELENKIENFIKTTVMPAFSKVGEDLYQDGIKTRFVSKPWKKNISKKQPLLHLFDLDLSHEENEFCKISSYIAIREGNQIEFGSSIKKIYAEDTFNELVIEDIEKIEKNKLADDILKKI